MGLQTQITSNDGINNQIASSFQNVFQMSGGQTTDIADDEYLFVREGGQMLADDGTIGWGAFASQFKQFIGDGQTYVKGISFVFQSNAAISSGTCSLSLMQLDTSGSSAVWNRVSGMTAQFNAFGSGSTEGFVTFVHIPSSAVLLANNVPYTICFQNETGSPFRSAFLTCTYTCSFGRES